MSDTALPVIFRFDTTANRLAFTPTPGVGEQLYVWLDSDNQPNAYYWDGANWQAFNTAGSGIDQLTGQVTAGPGSGSQAATINKPYIPFALCQGRLTTESGVPVSTSDRTAQSTIYWTPYLGNQLGLYSGSAWIMFNQAELSLVLSGLTSDKNYDVFIDYNSGTPQLVLSAAWTNDTTRADVLALQDGIYVKSGSTTLRWVGTIRTTGTTTTEDSAQNRFVANYYNEVERKMFIQFPNTYNYGSTTWRETNGSSSYRLNILIPLTKYSLKFCARHFVVSGSGGGTEGRGALAIDSSTTPDTNSALARSAIGGFSFLPLYCDLVTTPTTGFHYITKLEAGNGTSVEWRGVDAGIGNTGALYGTIFN